MHPPLLQVRRLNAYNPENDSILKKNTSFIPFLYFIDYGEMAEAQDENDVKVLVTGFGVSVQRRFLVQG